MLVVSSLVPQNIRVSVEESYQLIILDRSNLRYLAASDPTLLSELEALLIDESETVEDILAIEPDLDRQIKTSGNKKPPPPDTLGPQLIAELETVVKGRVDWTTYEKICAKVLKYLFKDELENWFQQLRTDGGGSRYDLVCRIKPGTHFWDFLINDLKSRYIVFEFKNYAKSITQG